MQLAAIGGKNIGLTRDKLIPFKLTSSQLCDHQSIKNIDVEHGGVGHNGCLYFYLVAMDSGVPSIKASIH